MPDLFNEKAKDFDASEMVKNLSSAIGESILDNIDFHEKMNVMDFGAGTGLISSYVAPLVNKIVAVDISEAMLEKLVSKSELHGKVETLCQNILDDPIDTQFDIIMSAMAMHHIEDIHKLMLVFSKNLKSGAKLVLADLDKEDGSFHPEGTEGVYHSGFDRDALQIIIENSGFYGVQFFTAHIINGVEKEYPVFLIIATKH